jgi:hypothetical protein
VRPHLALKDKSFYTQAISTDAAVACSEIRAGYNKRAEAVGEDAFKRCFAQRAPQQPSFAEAIKQAQALLAMAIGLQ